MPITSREQAKDLAEQIYFATENKTTPISKTSLEAAVKQYLGYSATMPLETMPFYQRFRVANLRDVIIQEGYFKACDDGLGYMIEVAKIREGI